jgi:hypothetical protein
VDQLGPNALGEVLQPGRVADCYLGLLLPPGPAGEPEAGTILIITPAALLHPRVPQPDGGLVYELLTGHPEREAGELLFVADLTGELRAWPHDTWAKLGVDPDQVAQAVIGCWRDREVAGLQVDELGFEEARSLTRPAMTCVATSFAAASPLGSAAPTSVGSIRPAAAAPATGSCSGHARTQAMAGRGRLAVGVRTPRRGSHEALAILGPDGIASFDQTLVAAHGQGAHQPATAGLPREPRRAVGRGAGQPRARDAGRRGLGPPTRHDGPDRGGPCPRLP